MACNQCKACGSGLADSCEAMSADWAHQKGVCPNCGNLLSFEAHSEPAAEVQAPSVHINAELTDIALGASEAAQIPSEPAAESAPEAEKAEA